MKALRLLSLLMFISIVTLVAQPQSPSPYPFTTQQDSVYVRENYTKMEFMVEMRDGIKLFTQVYAPKDTIKKHPILMQRTPYSCQPYGLDPYRRRVSPNPFMLRDDYIMVYQDVRGRWASEGKFIEMTPHIDKKTKKTDIDECASKSKKTRSGYGWLSTAYSQ